MNERKKVEICRQKKVEIEAYRAYNEEKCKKDLNEALLGEFINVMILQHKLLEYLIL